MYFGISITKSLQNCRFWGILISLRHVKSSFGGYLCLLRFCPSIIWFKVAFLPPLELKHCGLVIIVSGL